MEQIHKATEKSETRETSLLDLLSDTIDSECRRLQVKESGTDCRFFVYIGTQALEAAATRIEGLVGDLCALLQKPDHGGVRTVLQLRRTTQSLSDLVWEADGVAKPPSGQELTNKKLSQALESKTQFTQDEWNKFGITGLRADHFIKSGASYFRPAPPEREVQFNLSALHDVKTLRWAKKVDTTQPSPLEDDAAQRGIAIQQEDHLNASFGLAWLDLTWLGLA